MNSDLKALSSSSVLTCVNNTALIQIVLCIKEIFLLKENKITPQQSFTKVQLQVKTQMKLVQGCSEHTGGHVLFRLKELN